VLVLVLRTTARTTHTALKSVSRHAPEQRLPALWDVPPFAFASGDGQSVSDSALRGHVWIADFIFTRCTTMCPIITAKMTLVRRAIPSASIRFVSFSIDPEYDTPAVLRAFAAQWHPDPRWLLLRPPLTQAADFANAMHVPFERSTDPAEPILHTSLFFLVDRRGRVRGTYGSLDDQAVLRLVADAAALDLTDDSLGAGDPKREIERSGTPDSSRGLALFQALGCGACHDNAHTAPALGGMAGHVVQLEGGATVVADDAYLRQSILAPDAQVVAGYNPLMPAYGGYLTQTEVGDLVAYLHSATKTAAAVSPAAGRVGSELEALDPVCGMRIKRLRAAAHAADDDGKTYYFCSELCRDRFVKDPSKYVSPEAPGTERPKGPR
jgi:protein SCO1/2